MLGLVIAANEECDRACAELQGHPRFGFPLFRRRSYLLRECAIRIDAHALERGSVKPVKRCAVFMGAGGESDLLPGKVHARCE